MALDGHLVRSARFRVSRTFLEQHEKASNQVTPAAIQPGSTGSINGTAIGAQSARSILADVLAGAPLGQGILIGSIKELWGATVLLSALTLQLLGAPTFGSQRSQALAVNSLLDPAAVDHSSVPGRH